MLGNIGTVELFLIMLAILLVFGAKRIPEIAQGVGKGIREFRSAMREISSELQVEDRQMHRATDLRSAPARSTTSSGRAGQTHGAPVYTPSAAEQSDGAPAFAPADDRAANDAATPDGYGTGR